MTTVSRNMIFVSHANPEDNIFSRWLSLRLAREGYPVWCDLTKFLGGEDFWKDIEHAIRERTIKFLYVLSKASNVKDGALQELHVAKGIQKSSKIEDFVIPLKIDDLSYGDVNIQLARINAVDFFAGWAQGLATLLKKLQEDNISKDARFSASSVNDWWRVNFSSELGVNRTPEEYLSNWFPFEMPGELEIHTLRRSGIGPMEVDNNTFLYPAYQDGIDLISFASSKDLAPALPLNFEIAHSHRITTEAFLEDEERRVTNRNIIKYLLKRAWYLMLSRRSELLTRPMANHRDVFSFKRGFQQSEFLSFTGIDGTKQRRQLVGYKTLLGGRKRYWHFGFDIRPSLWPFACFGFTTHVTFSDDGLTLWDNARRSHKARRSQCKNWYNDDWRDRLLAAIEYFSTDGKVLVPVSSKAVLRVARLPVLFDSPVSFSEPDSLNFDLTALEGLEDAEDPEDMEDSTESWDDRIDSGDEFEDGEIR